MQLICPNCQSPITVDLINIQEMTAVCGTCHTVFGFDRPQSKQKQRKLKEPDTFDIRESDDNLHMSYGLTSPWYANENIIGGIIVGLAFFLFGFVFRDGAKFSPIIPLAIWSVALFSILWTIAFIMNRTHINMNDESIDVSRKPISALSSLRKLIDMTNVEAIHIDETAQSKTEGYETPKYRIWAEMSDRRQETILKDLIEPYASVVAQRLQNYLADMNDYEELFVEDALEDIVENDTDGDLLLHVIAEAEQQQQAQS